MTNDRKGLWSQTYTGVRFWPLDPRPDEVRLEDIAHSLSLLCRFGGHIRTHYSVAQHSVLVSGLLPEHLKLTGLLHDATEAYLVDLPRPVKASLPDYVALEHAMAEVIAIKFNPPMLQGHQLQFEHPAVKEADNIMLMTEARDLFMTKPPADWGVTATPTLARITPWTAPQAEAAFLHEFKRLTQPYTS